MKKIITILIISIMLITNSGCSFFEDNKTTKNSNKEQMSQNSKENMGADNKTNSESKSSNEAGRSEKKQTITLYFANEDNSLLVKEERSVVVTDGAVLRSAIKALMDGPQKKGLRKTIPEGTSLLGIRRDGNTAILDFSKEYNKSNDIAEIIERISIVNTLTNLQGIEKVKILVEGKDLIGPSGEPLGEMKKASLDKSGRPVSGMLKNIKIYFGSPDSDYIVSENRNIVTENNSSQEMAVLKELISGPSSKDLYPVIPKGTKILSVKTTKDGSCTVDLSKEFVNNAFLGSAGAEITINAIVDSLTENKSIKKVMFLIEGKERESYSDLEFNKPFLRNESIIKSSKK
ncbi:MAG: GerMN domain-containing protein [Bacillota bacterium]|nr:GerMN domain-containing protein [Bacillota bacterium]